MCGQDEVSTSAFDMYAWRLLSSTNMRDWTDHGRILRPDAVNWMPDNRAWAASFAIRNGYFYLYTASDWQVGVMRAYGYFIKLFIIDNQKNPQGSEFGSRIKEADFPVERNKT